MRVIRHVSHAGAAARPRVIAVGRFDGVHRGHQRVLACVVDRARAVGGEAAAVVVRDDHHTLRLVDRRQQLELLRDAGLATVVFAPAADVPDAVAALAPTVHIVSRGSVATTPVGGRLEEIAVVEVGGVPVSARTIQTALSRGDLPAARDMLGRDPGVSGRVVHGFHRGGPLGIPTANLRVRGVQLPPDGVYAVRAYGAGAVWRGVANIGFNPTFGNETRTVETHLLDFRGDLYGRRLAIGFVARLRGEQKFVDVQALLAQIRSDIDAARRLFEQA